MTTSRFPSSVSPNRKRFEELSLYQAELVNRLRWFIRLRWLGTTGLLLGVFYAYLTTGYSSHLTPFLWFTLSIMAYNSVFAAVNYYLRNKTTPAAWKNIAFALLQLFVDLTTLTLVVHWTGGVSSVFVIHYVFPLAMASLLLHRRECFLIAGFASAALDVMVYLEAVEYLPSHPILGITLGYSEAVGNITEAHQQPVLLFCLFYNVAFFITVTLTSAVSRRLREREHEIEMFNTQLNEVNEAKSNFMRMASHEMRGPLSAVDGMLRIFSTKIQEKGEDPECMELLARCENRLHSIHELIGDLLDYSRLQTVDTVDKKAPVGWGSVVAQSLEVLRPMADDSKIELNASLSPCKILGDGEQLLTLSNNLIHNALRYTPEGGKIDVRLRADGRQAVLEVEDNGIGIDPRAMDYIFEEFFRAPNAKEYETAGTGLGLTMCKTIVENHGGRITAKSVPNQRTVFTVTMPLV